MVISLPSARRPRCAAPSRLRRFLLRLKWPGKASARSGKTRRSRRFGSNEGPRPREICRWRCKLKRTLAQWTRRVVLPELAQLFGENDQSPWITRDRKLAEAMRIAEALLFAAA